MHGTNYIDCEYHVKSLDLATLRIGEKTASSPILLGTWLAKSGREIDVEKDPDDVAPQADLLDEKHQIRNGIKHFNLLSQLRHYQKELFEVLFPANSELLSLYLEHQKKRLRLRLRLEKSLQYLNALHWEVLCEALPETVDSPSRGPIEAKPTRYFSRGERGLFVRVLNQECHLSVLNDKLLRVLVAVTAPDSPTPFQSSSGEESILGHKDVQQASIEPISRTTLTSDLLNILNRYDRTFQVDVLNNITSLDAFRTKIQTGGYHILHMVAHGDANGSVYLCNTQGAPQKTPPEVFAEAVPRTRHLRLINLMVCNSGQSETFEPQENLAAALVERGFPAVVAMGGRIKESTAKYFSEGFYKTLQASGELDYAVNSGRQSIYLQQDDGDEDEEEEWILPRLFTQTGSQKLWRTLQERARRRNRWSRTLNFTLGILILATLSWFVRFDFSAPTKITIDPDLPALPTQEIYHRGLNQLVQIELERTTSVLDFSRAPSEGSRKIEIITSLEFPEGTEKQDTQESSTDTQEDSTEFTLTVTCHSADFPHLPNWLPWQSPKRRCNQLNGTILRFNRHNSTAKIEERLHTVLGIQTREKIALPIDTGNNLTAISHDIVENLRESSLAYLMGDNRRLNDYNGNVTSLLGSVDELLEDLGNLIQSEGQRIKQTTDNFRFMWHTKTNSASNRNRTSSLNSEAFRESIKQLRRKKYDKAAGILAVLRWIAPTNTTNLESPLAPPTILSSTSETPPDLEMPLPPSILHIEYLKALSKTDGNFDLALEELGRFIGLESMDIKACGEILSSPEHLANLDILVVVLYEIVNMHAAELQKDNIDSAKALIESMFCLQQALSKRKSPEAYQDREPETAADDEGTNGECNEATAMTRNLNNYIAQISTLWPKYASQRFSGRETKEIIQSLECLGIDIKESAHCLSTTSQEEAPCLTIQSMGISSGEDIRGRIYAASELVILANRIGRSDKGRAIDLAEDIIHHLPEILLNPKEGQDDFLLRLYLGILEGNIGIWALGKHPVDFELSNEKLQASYQTLLELESAFGNRSNTSLYLDKVRAFLAGNALQRGSYRSAFTFAKELEMYDGVYYLQEDAIPARLNLLRANLGDANSEIKDLSDHTLSRTSKIKGRIPYLEANAHFLKGDFRNTINSIKAIDIKDEGVTDIYALWLWSDALIGLGATEEARALLSGVDPDAIHKFNPNTYLTHALHDLAKARLSIAEKELDHAYDIMKKFREERPRSPRILQGFDAFLPEAFVTLAKIQFQRGDFEEAQEFNDLARDCLKTVRYLDDNGSVSPSIEKYEPLSSERTQSDPAKFAFAQELHRLTDLKPADRSFWFLSTEIPSALLEIEINMKLSNPETRTEACKAPSLSFRNTSDRLSWQIDLEILRAKYELWCGRLASFERAIDEFSRLQDRLTQSQREQINELQTQRSLL